MSSLELYFFESFQQNKLYQEMGPCAMGKTSAQQKNVKFKILNSRTKAKEEFGTQTEVEFGIQTEIEYPYDKNYGTQTQFEQEKNLKTFSQNQSQKSSMLSAIHRPKNKVNNVKKHQQELRNIIPSVVQDQQLLQIDFNMLNTRNIEDIQQKIIISEVHYERKRANTVQQNKNSTRQKVKIKQTDSYWQQYNPQRDYTLEKRNNQKEFIPFTQSVIISKVPQKRETLKDKVTRKYK